MNSFKNPFSPEAYELVGRDVCYKDIMTKFFLVVPSFLFFFSTILSASSVQSQDLIGDTVYITKELNFTDQDLFNYFSKNRGIKNLVINQCSLITDEGIRTLSNLIPNLESLALMFCPQLTDSSLEYVCKIQSLKEFSLCDNDQITDYGILLIANNLFDLEKLSICKCKKITDQGIIGIAEHLSKLNELNISGCILITDSSIEMIANHLPSLYSISFSLCSLISDKAIFALCDSLKGLEFVNMICCPKLTDDAIEYMAKELPLLKSLIICGCPLVTHNSVQYLIDQRRNLIFLAVSIHDHLTEKKIEEIRKFRSDYDLLVYDGTEEILQKFPSSLYVEVLKSYIHSLMGWKISQKSLKYFKVFPSEKAQGFPWEL